MVHLQPTMFKSYVNNYLSYKVSILYNCVIFLLLNGEYKIVIYCMLLKKVSYLLVTTFILSDLYKKQNFDCLFTFKLYYLNLS